jgi:hypothetical protein
LESVSAVEVLHYLVNATLLARGAAVDPEGTRIVGFDAAQEALGFRMYLDKDDEFAMSVPGL